MEVFMEGWPFVPIVTTWPKITSQQKWPSSYDWLCWTGLRAKTRSPQEKLCKRIWLKILIKTYVSYEQKYPMISLIFMDASSRLYRHSNGVKPWTFLFKKIKNRYMYINIKASSYSYHIFKFMQVITTKIR